MKLKILTIVITLLISLLYIPVDAGQTNTLRLNQGEIIITNNDGLADFDGSGTEADPYLISFESITGDGTQNLISISGTTSYFMISNSTMSGGTNGIKLENVQNAIIAGNEIHGNSQNGILVIESDNVVLLENKLYNNGAGACSQSLSLKSHSGSGAWFDPSSNIKVYGNEIYGNKHDGVIIDSATNMLIQGNNIYGNGNLCFSSISLDSTSHLGHAVNLVSASAVQIMNNLITDQSSYGVYFESETSNNTVENNNFINNNNSNIQAKDDGPALSNTFNGNYWSDDVNADIYHTDGTAKSNDTNPQDTLNEVTYPDLGIEFPVPEANEDDSPIKYTPVLIVNLFLLFILRNKVRLRTKKV